MRYNLSVIIGFAICIFTTSLEAQETMVISTFPDDDAPLVIIAERVIRDAYTRLGIEVEIQYLPGERAIHSANYGKTDGELFRVAEINQTYSNLLMVPVPISYVEIVVFTKNVNFPVEGWESLRPYRIGFQQGMKLIEAKTKGMKVSTTNSSELTFKLLKLNRFDIAVEPRKSGLYFVKNLHLSDITILEPPLERIPTYHYLNKKHQDLLPKLENILRQMEQEGTIQKINDEVIAEFLG